MARNDKVVRFHNVPKINIGVIIFGLIFIFILVQIIRSANQQHVSVYEVQKSYMNTNISGTAIALREEVLESTAQAGYVNYYIRNGEKVGKNATVYTVDANGTLSDIIAEAGVDTTINQAGYSEIRTSISNFQNYFTETNFSDVYDFKYDLDSQVLDVANSQILEELTAADSSVNSFAQVRSTQSGVVTYYQDGYESKKPADISKADFDTTNYTKNSLKTGEILQAGSPVYKLITSEYWNLVLPLSAEDAERLKEDTRVTLNIQKVYHEVYGDIEVIQNGSDYFANITLDKMMINYCDDRFVNIEIVMTSEEGLNIPNSSIIEKNVLKIPMDYMVAGVNSNTRTYVNIRTLDENGNLSISQFAPKIYDADEEYCYLNPDDFDVSAVLVKNNSDETLAIAQAPRMVMKGVYNINRGSATFQKITVLAEDEEFTIVKDGDPYSLSMYDRIILDASMVEEGTVIN